jgi:hypothetical protein
MTLEGTIRLDMTEINQAIAEYVGRIQGIKISGTKVRVLPTGEMGSFGVQAYVDVSQEVEIIRDRPSGTI